jgi:hypothetical protein
MSNHGSDPDAYKNPEAQSSGARRSRVMSNANRPAGYALVRRIAMARRLWHSTRLYPPARRVSPIFYHPDSTVGPGFTPVSALRLAALVQIADCRLQIADCSHE